MAERQVMLNAESAVKPALHSDAHLGAWGNFGDDLRPFRARCGDMVSNRQQSRMELEGRNVGDTGKGIAV